MKTALITGASAGLGLEFAKIFAKERCNLVVIARGKEKLSKIATELSEKYGIKVEVIIADLSDVTSPKRIYDILTEKILG